VMVHADVVTGSLSLAEQWDAVIRPEVVAVPVRPRYSRHNRHRAERDV
jgi:hypothetical protein